MECIQRKLSAFADGLVNSLTAAFRIANLKFFIKCSTYNASMTSSHLKRNLGVAGLVAVVVAIFVFQIFSQINLAFQPINVEYAINAPSRFEPGQTNSFSVNCTNHDSARATYFYLIVTFEGAFSSQSPQAYVEANDSSVKFLFDLKRAGNPTSTLSKTVQFSINENVSAFSIGFSLQRYGGYSLPSYNYAFTNSIQYQWNASTSCYEESGRIVVIA